MAAKSILLKVSPEVHTGIQEAAGRHQRSMQGVLVALIEGWLAAGGPDPLLFGMEKPMAPSSEAVDPEARQAIEALVERVGVLQEQVSRLTASRDPDGPGWAQRVLFDLGARMEHADRSEGTSVGSGVVVPKIYDGRMTPERRAVQAEQRSASRRGNPLAQTAGESAKAQVAAVRELVRAPSVAAAAPSDADS